MKLNEKLKEFRLKNNLTQKEFANILNVSLSTLQKYEYGSINLSYDTILYLCDYFHIKLNEFFNDVVLNDNEKKALNNFIDMDEYLNQLPNENIEIINQIIKENSFNLNDYEKRLLLAAVAIKDLLLIYDTYDNDKTTVSFNFFDGAAPNKDYNVKIKIEDIKILSRLISENVRTTIKNFIELGSIENIIDKPKNK